MAGHRIGVYVCMCGTNIANTVNVDEVVESIGKMDEVAIARSYKYMCSNPGQEMIINDVKDLDLDRVVVAACSPRMHEPTFRKALETAGLNPYFVEMANIREQCSWVHDDGRAATEKATFLTRAMVEKVARNEPLDKRSVPMSPATLVIGGGITGLTAALELAEGDQTVYLVEREEKLGGNVARLDLTAPYLDSARDLLSELITKATRHPHIVPMLKSNLIDMNGFIGNFTCRVRDGEGEEVDLMVGSVVVCTGYREFDASRVKAYGYGKLPDVITSFELESMIRQGKIRKKDGNLPQYVTLIHCVGSRSEEFHPYCSRVCCMTALKYAHEVKSAIPDSYVSDLYIDMHAFGKGCEDFYRKSSETKTMFLMYGKNSTPSVRLAGKGEDCEMFLTVQEQLSGEEIEIPTDLIVLMVGMEPREDSEQVARLVNISRDKDGWFIESHPKLDPVATTTDGVYIAGACQSPKDIPDSVAQARAAAARILAHISQGEIWTDAVYAEIDGDLCSGCRICNELCPYSAIEFDEEKKKSSIISAVCKACGACVAACPSGAIKARHFTDEQIFAQLEGVL